MPPARQALPQSPQRLQSAVSLHKDNTRHKVFLSAFWLESSSPALLFQVRDFVFSPDSGRIGALRFDALGLPSLPDAFLTCKEVGMQDVQEVSRLNCVRNLWFSAGRTCRSQGLRGALGIAAVLPMQGLLQVRGFQSAMCLRLIISSIFSIMSLPFLPGPFNALGQPTVFAEVCL